MMNHTDATYQPGRTAGQSSESERPEPSRGPTRHGPLFPGETEQAMPSSGSPSSSNNHEHGHKFDAPGGIQNINAGLGDQFPYATFDGPVTFNQNRGNWNDRAQRETEFLRCLNTSPYRDRKNRNPDRVPGTCEWFVSHKLFRDWEESKVSKILWVSADPGCGKSVLAKYLVDSVLQAKTPRTVCYFFFKDDFEDQRSVVSALSCVLHQLFLAKPGLLTDAILKRFELGGENFTRSFGDLWDALIHVAKEPDAGEIVCLFDAIDECEDDGRAQLAKMLYNPHGPMGNFNLKFLLTSRPYSGIRRDLQPLLQNTVFPMIHLSGESPEEALKISREIDVFIAARVKEIRGRLVLTKDERDLLFERLMRVPNRTYLWVYLTLDLIESDYTNKSKIVEATSQLPETVDEVYEKILSKSHNLEEAQRILHIVVAAARPLTLGEMTLALALRENHLSYRDLDLEPEDRFREKVRNICGLFITIINSKIYLFHQTAKEFLVPKDTANSVNIHSDLKWIHSLRPQVSRRTKRAHRDLKWKHSLRPTESHRILAEICIWHLLLAEFKTLARYGDGYQQHTIRHDLFLDYSAKHWAAHFHELPLKTQKAMTPSLLRFCNTTKTHYPAWFGIYWTSTNTDFPQGFTSLMITSYFGLANAVERLLKMDDIDLDSRDYVYKRSALSWAAANGFGNVVKLLIKGKGLKLPFRNKFQIDSVDIYGRTPLSYAVWNGNVAVVKLLIKAGAKPNSKDEIGGTPLFYAICNEHDGVINLLLKEGIQLESEDNIREGLLLSAAARGHEAVIKLFIERGIDVNLDAQDKNGRTLLSRASGSGQSAVVKLLLEQGAKVDLDNKDNKGRTPLSWAAGHGYEVVVRLLIGQGANVELDTKDSEGRTPLLWAVAGGYLVVTKLLLGTNKVDPDTKDNEGRSPLSWAAGNGKEAVFKLLLGRGANDELDTKDSEGRTPLSWAVSGGLSSTAIVVSLLEQEGNVDPDTKDNSGQTPLSWAARSGCDAAVSLLLDTNKVEPDSKDTWGQTPLWWAVFKRRQGVVKLMLDSGRVDPDTKNCNGWTPLWLAVSISDEDIVRLLLDTGQVDLNTEDAERWTLLGRAVHNQHETIVWRLLRTEKVNLDVEDSRGFTPLQLAVRTGNMAIVTLLLDTGQFDQETRANAKAKTNMWLQRRSSLRTSALASIQKPRAGYFRGQR